MTTCPHHYIFSPMSGECIPKIAMKIQIITELRKYLVMTSETKKNKRLIA